MEKTGGAPYTVQEMLDHAMGFYMQIVVGTTRLRGGGWLPQLGLHIGFRNRVSHWAPQLGFHIGLHNWVSTLGSTFGIPPGLHGTMDGLADFKWLPHETDEFNMKEAFGWYVSSELCMMSLLGEGSYMVGLHGE